MGVGVGGRTAATEKNQGCVCSVVAGCVCVWGECIAFCEVYDRTLRGQKKSNKSKKRGRVREESVVNWHR